MTAVARRPEPDPRDAGTVGRPWVTRSGLNCMQRWMPPPSIEPAEVREPMARVHYYSGYEGPYVKRLDAGEDEWNSWHEFPERLVADYEQAKAVCDAAEKALETWVGENKPEEIEPTGERT